MFIGNISGFGMVGSGSGLPSRTERLRPLKRKKKKSPSVKTRKAEAFPTTRKKSTKRKKRK